MEYKCRVTLTKDEWLSVITSGLTDKDLRLLDCVASMPDHKASALELTEPLAVSHYSVVNFMVGNLGKRIQKALHLPQPDTTYSSSEWWSYAFSGERLTSRNRSRTTEYYWSMSDSLYEAVLELSKNTKKDNVNDQRIFNEGAPFEIALTRHERNHDARAACIAHYKSVCQICGFSFRGFYGADFEGIIQVHHLEVISNAEENHIVDPIHDLIPVCPNCHAALHKRTPPYSPQELRNKVNEHRNIIQPD